MIHRLTEKDVENRTAVCSVDGEVPIYASGKRGWICSVKHAEGTRKWLRENPEYRFRRRKGNPHILSNRDLVAREADCAECKRRTTIEPWGRGWICSFRANQLGRNNPQGEPAARCRDCWDDDRTWVDLTPQGCPRCSRSLNQQLLDMAAAGRELERADVDAMSFTVVGLWADPYQMPDDESVVPGWRTIGAPDPVGV